MNLVITDNDFDLVCDDCGETSEEVSVYNDRYLCQSCHEDAMYGRHEDQERHGWEQV